MSGEQRGRILEAMDAEDADVVRRLLSYEEATAGGMMTPDPIVLGPTATVAEALAQIREPDRVVSVAAQVFVCQAPFKAPTGKLLGTAHMQRLLREQPSTELRQCVSEDPVVAPEASHLAVAELLASYDMLAVAGVRPGRSAARCGDGRRRPGPPARCRLAPAPTGGDAPGEDRVTP
jgi:Mg/Co/Ni transporter MgtE